MRHFGRILSFGCMLAILVAFGSSAAVAQKKKDAKDKDKDKYPAAMDADYKAIQKQKELNGKLVTIDGAMVTLRVEYPHSEANPNYKPPKVITNPKTAGYNSQANQQAQMYKTYNDIMQQQQNAAKAKNPQEYQRAMMRVQQDMAKLQQEIMRMNQQMAKAGAANADPNNQPFIIVSSTKDFDLELKDKVVLRKLVLAFEYDDLGAPKTYTDKEKAELRGDDKSKPGYMAKLEDFRAGQEIKLSLTLPKKKEADKDAEKEKDAKAPEEVIRPIVTMVVMTKDAATTSTIQGADDKKKKK